MGTPDPTQPSLALEYPSHAALVLAGHGSTENPDSSAPTFQHADAIRRRGLFREVACAFWKEEPSFRQLYRMLESEEIFVVPNFISEGYFTREVIPRELELDPEAMTTRVHGKRVHYCDPVGVHPTMARLLLKRAREIAPDIPPEECSLLVVGHGTGLNPNSRKAVEDQVAHIRTDAESLYAEVLDTYMEEEPRITHWREIAKAPNVVVVPFFVSDGLHSYQDIPVMLGIEKEVTEAASQREVFRHNPHHLDGRNLFYSSAIGTEADMAEVILDQVRDFIARSPDLSHTS